MRAPRNRRVVIAGCEVVTALGTSLQQTWNSAVRGRPCFELADSCEPLGLRVPVGRVNGFDARAYSFGTPREIAKWDAAFVLLTMAVCQGAVATAGVDLSGEIGTRTACFMGSALCGQDAFRTATDRLQNSGYLRVSPFLLPNLCANVPAGKAGELLGFTGPIIAPGGACASGNHAIAMGARMIRDGDVDVAIVGGVDTPIVTEIVVGFANMNAVIKLRETDRAWDDPNLASRPFSVDRKGFVLAEGAAALVLVADEVAQAHGLTALAEVLGVGWTSDAHHVTRLHEPTVVRAMRQAIDDAELTPDDIDCINAHGTSTITGDAVEVTSLRQVFGERLCRVPVTANKSLVGHSLGGAAAIEAALAIEGMQRGQILPTANHLSDPELEGLDLVAGEVRHQPHELILSNSFGFGGTNCCVVLRGM